MCRAMSMIWRCRVAWYLRFPACTMRSAESTLPPVTQKSCRILRTLSWTSSRRASDQAPAVRLDPAGPQIDDDSRSSRLSASSSTAPAAFISAIAASSLGFDFPSPGGREFERQRHGSWRQASSACAEAAGHLRRSTMQALSCRIDKNHQIPDHSFSDLSVVPVSTRLGASAVSSFLAI